MKRHFLFLFVVLLALISIGSCKKTENTDKTEPVVIVAEDKSPTRSINEPKTFDKEIPTLTVAPDAEVEETKAEERKTLSYVYRGGGVLLKGSFQIDNGSIKTNVSEDDARAFALRLLEENPEYESIYSVSFSQDSVLLTYPSTLTEEDISSFWESIKVLMDKVNEEAKETEEESVEIVSEESVEIETDKSDKDVEDTTIEEVVTPQEPMESEDVKASSNESVEEISSMTTPLTKGGKTIVETSVSLSLSAKYDPQYGLDSDIRAAFDMAFSPSLSIGLGIGYEMTGYIPLTLRLRYNLPFLSGLYSHIGGGWRIGYGGRQGNLLLSFGLGYELEVLDEVYLFGEFDGDLVFMDKVRFMPSVAIGARYAF